MRPTKQERDKIRSRAEAMEPAYSLDSDATQLDKTKFALCRDFVLYLEKQGISQRQLAKLLGTDEARVSEIVNYKLWVINTDNLFNWHEKICPNMTSIRFAQ
jgi:predicted XRE-type DNA-binding protein